MKKQILIVIILAFSLSGFAQQDTTTVYSSPGYSNDPMRSKWYSKVEKKDSLYILSLFDKKDILREQISFADQKLEVREGAYSFFENGIEIQHGYFNKGYKNGEWIVYYPNRKVKETLNYAWGKLHGIYVSYLEDGHVENKGNYKRGNKVGVWRLHYNDGKLAYRERFDEDGNWIEGEYFAQNGEKISREKVVQKPNYPGGAVAFEKELSKKLKYPSEAAEKNIRGNVELNVLVLIDSTLEDIRVINSPDGALTKAALKVLKNLKAWEPGKELGVPVNMRHQIQIKF